MKKVKNILLALTILNFSARATDEVTIATQPCYESFAALTIFIHEYRSVTDVLDNNLTSALREQSSIIVASNCLLNSIAYFKNSEQNSWRARKLTKNISVLVPKNLIAEYRSRGHFSPDIDDDHVLGIYFSNQPELTAADLTKRTIGSEKLSAEATEGLLKLFIPRTDYWQRWHGTVSPKNWVLLFFSHGAAPFLYPHVKGEPIEYEGIIAGFLPSHMRKLLFTLSGVYGVESGDLPGIINISSCFIISCFTGDLNMLATFRKSQEKLTQSYDFSFPIILATPLAAEVSSLENSSFKSFFTILLHTCVHPDFLSATRYMFFTGDVNIPIIKKPGIPTFFPIDPNKSAYISKIMGLTRTDPLIIPDYFVGRNIKAILIEAPIIPFDIILKPMGPLPPFFSSEMGPSTHEFIGEFRAPSYSFSQIIDAFTTEKQLTWKAFKFNKIIAQDSAAKEKIFSDVYVINNLERYEKKGFSYQQVHILIMYTIDGRKMFFEKIIKTDKDLKLGERASKDAPPLNEAAKQDTLALFETIKNLAKNPYTKRDDLLPDATKAGKLFTAHIHKQKSEKIIEMFAQALQQLI